eukprot:3684402-Pleurochrysis_carterae.AAC.3
MDSEIARRCILGTWQKVGTGVLLRAKLLPSTLHLAGWQFCHEHRRMKTLEPDLSGLYRSK